jgi:hypothetical protein
MQMAGYGNRVELRLFNLLIEAAGIYYALRKFTQTHGKHINYFRALVTGVSTAAIGSFLFALFLFAYMKVDADFMESILRDEPMGRYLNAYISSFIVMLEGVFSGLLVTFVLINYVNTDEQ